MREDLKNLPEGKLAELERTMKILEQEEAEKPPDSDSEDPEWYDGKKVDETIFCHHLISVHPMKCVGGRLYDAGGVVEGEKLQKEIYDMISPYVKSNQARSVEKLMNALKIRTFCEDLPIQTDRIHVSNGTLYLDGRFTDEMQLCRNRLPVAYNPHADAPVMWLKFISELLEEDDIPTLQEFMGYVLIPTNRAQKMLLITGNGGEGKSRIGRVMRSILGDNMNTTSIQKLATDRFARADQEGILLMLDDDMKMEALSDTNILKSIVTMEDKIDLEKKGKQSTQGYIYVRIIGLGNGSLSSLYDRSEGFYRRQISLVVKEKDPNRVDDRKLGEKLIAESEGIFLWCLEGLHRLIAQDYNFTVSEHTRQRLEEAKKEDNNILDFLESKGYIRFEENTYATSKKLFAAYLMWCADNVEKPFSERTFSTYLKSNASKLNIIYDKNVTDGVITEYMWMSERMDFTEDHMV